MPTTLQPDGFDDNRSTDQRFLDLMLADEELLWAEFDAIVAAEWPGPPPDPPHRGAPAERHSGGRRQSAGRALTPASRPGPSATGGWLPQRSPPRRTGTTEDRKGR